MAPAELDLLTTDTASDPALDLAISEAVLRQVAAGDRPPTLRIYQPAPAVAFGRLDRLREGFSAGARAARVRGRTPLLRSVGGTAAVFDDRCVVVERTVGAPDVTAGLQERFDAHAAAVASALTGLGLDARIGALPGEYCPGRHSIHVGGAVKVAGIAQRAVRGGALVSAVVVVGGGPELRATVADVYAALGRAVDPAVAGALDEIAPDLTPAAVADALRAVHARGAVVRERAADADLLAAAGRLRGAHVVDER